MGSTAVVATGGKSDSTGVATGWDIDVVEGIVEVDKVVGGSLLGGEEVVSWAKDEAGRTSDKKIRVEERGRPENAHRHDLSERWNTILKVV